ncbi:YjbF family lipoprotein [Salipiger thiooxidans]|uniref:YjbF family lipoprotein n=1 Tax=Salipiger thiooxidans TaxID=282683 RepID=UPI001A8C0D8B|nr:YjbF family lipoprotein [Salipiger thiooxidans]MBN8189833.1 YjbF family lipoprotein [Salipiger thiooxidans]
MRFLQTLPLLAALLIAGCGSDRNEFSELWNTPIKRLWQGEEDRGNVRAALTPEVLAQIGRPTILLTVPGRENVESPFFAEERNGDTVTWLSVNNEFLLLQDGVLSGTRGLGGDLMNADLGEVHEALAGRRTQAVRIHRMLDGENHIVAESYVCDYAQRPERVAVGAYLTQVQATQIDETCTGVERVFENRYWLSGRGTIVRARQWAGEPLGYLEYERLSD